MARTNISKTIDPESQRAICEAAIQILRIYHPTLKTEKDANLRFGLDSMFDVLELATLPVFVSVSKIQGKPGGNSSFIKSFPEALLHLLPIEGGNMKLDNAVKTILTGLEAYSLLAAYRAKIISPKELDDIKQEKQPFMLGKFATNLVIRLKERHCLNDTREYLRLKDCMDPGRKERNGLQHNVISEDREKLNDTQLEEIKQKLADCFAYIYAVNRATYNIYMARNGGIRFQASVPGVLSFYVGDRLQGKERNIWLPGNELDKEYYSPLFQINSLVPLTSDTPCKVIFKPQWGSTITYDNFKPIPGEFVLVNPPQSDAVQSQIPNEHPNTPLMSERERQERPASQPEKATKRPIPSMVTTIDLNRLKDTPFAGGSFVGRRDEEGRPHDCEGRLLKDHYLFSGNFEHGIPSGEFVVKSTDSSQQILFKGSLYEDFSFNHGELTYIDTQKVFIGDFADNVCIQGEYYKEGRLVFKGTFTTVDYADGSKSIVFKEGTHYGEGCRYIGQFQFNKPHGYGEIVYNDSSKPSIKGRWIEGELVEKIKETLINQPKSQPEEKAKEHVSQTLPVAINNTLLRINLWINDEQIGSSDKESLFLSLPCGETITLTVDLPSPQKELVEKELIYKVPPEDNDEYLEWDLDAAYLQMRRQLPDQLANNGEAVELILPDGSNYCGQVNLLNEPHGQGIQIFQGCRYEGKFKDGKRHDEKGVLTYPNGDCYEGGFKEGKREGIARHRSRNGVTTWQRWKDDTFIEQL